MLELLRKSAARRELGRALEEAVSARARQPFLFAVLGVPDTVDGRFDMVALHAWMALALLTGTQETEAAQGLTDALFVGFDEALREQGSGDMGMGRRMKDIANAFYGRLEAYDKAAGDDEMAGALARNVWRGAAVDARARALADYVRQTRTGLAYENGVLDFGAAPRKMA
jgi:cytochrome b pre-mRNA-processing protein 3